MAIVWEKLEIGHPVSFGVRDMVRAKIPGGWLVALVGGGYADTQTTTATFVPDRDHEWDGNTLP